MNAICNIDRMESELNRQRLSRLAAKRNRRRVDNWKRHEHMINLLIAGRKKALRKNDILTVEG